MSMSLYMHSIPSDVIACEQEEARGGGGAGGAGEEGVEEARLAFAKLYLYVYVFEAASESGAGQTLGDLGASMCTLKSPRKRKSFFLSESSSVARARNL